MAVSPNAGDGQAAAVVVLYLIVLVYVATGAAVDLLVLVDVATGAAVAVLTVFVTLLERGELYTVAEGHVRVTV